jgi:nucleotide-binding universal stress UspA family protein
MSKIPQSVLTAVDFGDASARALAMSGFIARTCGASLRLLHAETVEAPAYFTSEQLLALEQQRRATRVQAEEFLFRFGQQHTTTPFSIVVDDRRPVDAILHASESADLVAMGTHGRRWPARWWLGSVAERVLRDTTRPLLIVRADMTLPVESLFAHALVHAAAPLIGAGTLKYARDLGACFHGEVADGRHDLIEPALERTCATILIVATPHPRTAEWLSNYGEPLVRDCTLPILFVPEFSHAAPS